MELKPDGTRQIALSREQYESINGILQSFYRQTKCGVVMLSDVSGLCVAMKGTKDQASMALLSSLAAGNYAATGEIARLINEESSFRGQFHEGKTQSIYLKGINEDFFITVVFGKQITFGMIRVQVEKVIEELAQILAMIAELAPAADGTSAGTVLDAQVKNDLQDQSFQDELSSRLDAILGKF